MTLWWSLIVSLLPPRFATCTLQHVTLLAISELFSCDSRRIYMHLGGTCLVRGRRTHTPNASMNSNVYMYLRPCPIRSVVRIHQRQQRYWSWGSVSVTYTFPLLVHQTKHGILDAVGGDRSESSHHPTCNYRKFKKQNQNRTEQEQEEEIIWCRCANVAHITAVRNSAQRVWHCLSVLECERKKYKYIMIGRLGEQN